MLKARKVGGRYRSLFCKMEESLEKDCGCGWFHQRKELRKAINIS